MHTYLLSYYFYENNRPRTKQKSVKATCLQQAIEQIEDALEKQYKEVIHIHVTSVEERD